MIVKAKWKGASLWGVNSAAAGVHTVIPVGVMLPWCENGKVPHQALVFICGLLHHTFCNHLGNPLGCIPLSVQSILSYYLVLRFSRRPRGAVVMWYVCMLCVSLHVQLSWCPFLSTDPLPWTDLVLWMLVTASPNRGYRTAIAETSWISLLSAWTYAWPCSFCPMNLLSTFRLNNNFTENRNTMQLNYTNHINHINQSKFFYVPAYAASLGQACHAYELWH